jgi:hypothetical protein
VAAVAAGPQDVLEGGLGEIGDLAGGKPGQPGLTFEQAAAVAAIRYPQDGQARGKVVISV